MLVDRAGTGDPDTGRTAALGWPRAALRAVAALRFVPPVSWLFGASVLHRQGDLVFRLHPARNHQDRVLWVTGRFDEARSMAALARLVRGRRALVLDVGANVGLYGITLARAAGEGTRVLAFEPNPETFRALADNVALNGLEGRVDLRPQAVGDHTGEVTLHVPALNLGAATVRSRGWGRRTRRVAMGPLAPHLARARDYDRVVVKLDVEGGEDTALLPVFDALDPADWPDAVLLEVSWRGRWRQDVCARLEALGYTEEMRAERNRLYLRPRAGARHADASPGPGCGAAQ